MSPKPIGELVAEWRDAAKSTTLQDVYSEESGPYFGCAQKLEALLREWQEHCNSEKYATYVGETCEMIFGLKESESSGAARAHKPGFVAEEWASYPTVEEKPKKDSK